MNTQIKFPGVSLSIWINWVLRRVSGTCCKWRALTCLPASETLVGATLQLFGYPIYWLGILQFSPLWKEPLHLYNKLDLVRECTAYLPSSQSKELIPSVFPFTMTCLEAGASRCLLQIRPIKITEINFATFLPLSDSPFQEFRLLPEQIACSTAKAQPCSDL